MAVKKDCRLLAESLRLGLRDEAALKIEHIGALFDRSRPPAIQPAFGWLAQIRSGARVGILVTAANSSVADSGRPRERRTEQNGG